MGKLALSTLMHTQIHKIRCLVKNWLMVHHFSGQLKKEYWIANGLFRLGLEAAYTALKITHFREKR